MRWYELNRSCAFFRHDEKLAKKWREDSLRGGTHALCALQIRHCVILYRNQEGFASVFCRTQYGRQRISTGKLGAQLGRGPKRAGQPVRILFGNNVGAWRCAGAGAALRRTRSKGQSGGQRRF